ncbi:hypothetical protein SAMN05443637_1156 [Pseudonocardia thermophila]|uniref:Uncharacterized protein n=1 Tax=Pseudonocardia thermophila TaxID=1848 RepID=A0A1M6WN12_PSETH|nr:hypothetical protein [Pseudonocardia thermophila]SHK95016.1 hypothetical protein SAMN05443637_1156 [Pseudonocardia thermophila]
MTALALAETADRTDLGAFVARVVRLDATATVRLRAVDGHVTAWATTPFDVLATRTVAGTLEPPDVTAPASALLTALTVVRSEVVDPGPGTLWPAELPPESGWTLVDEVPAAEIERLTERGLEVAREHAGPHGLPTSLLDQVVLTVTGGDTTVKVPLRCLFALSGMGFTGGEPDPVRVSATGSWLRLDARYGAVARRRVTSLPLLF